MGKEWPKPSPKLLEKTHHLMHDGFHQRAFPGTKYDLPEALGDARWTDELIASTWYMAETGECPDHLNFKTGKFRCAAGSQKKSGKNHENKKP